MVANVLPYDDLYDSTATHRQEHKNLKTRYVQVNLLGYAYDKQHEGFADITQT